MVDLNNPILKERKKFYNPHPGLAGATIPIPNLVKSVADNLNGKVMTLGEAILRLRAVTDDKIELVEEYKFITLSIKEPTGTKHAFRVIRYKNPHQ